MNISFSRTTLIAAIAACAVSFPATSFAATTQQSLDAATTKLFTNTPAALYAKTPVRIDTNVDVKLTERALATSKSPVLTGSMHIHRTDRPFTATQDERTWTLDSYSMPTGYGMNPVITPADPFSIETKIVNNVSYLHISKFPQVFLKSYEAEGVDTTAVTSLIGPWIIADKNSSAPVLAIANFPETISDQAGVSTILGYLTDFRSDAADTNTPVHFRVLRIEKRSVDAQKHTILRLQVDLSPTDVVRVRNAWLKYAKDHGITVTKDGKQLDTAKSIMADYADFQKNTSITPRHRCS